MSGFEVVGAIAAAGQFLEQGLKVYGLYRSIRHQIQDAPEEIHQRTERMESFEAVARNIRDTKAFQTTQTERILTRCDGYASSLSTILEGIKFKSEDPLVKKTWSAVGGLRKEKEILGLFNMLDEEQGLLSLHLQTLDS